MVPVRVRISTSESQYKYTAVPRWRSPHRGLHASRRTRVLAQKWAFTGPVGGFLLAAVAVRCLRVGPAERLASGCEVGSSMAVVLGRVCRRHRH